MCRQCETNPVYEFTNKRKVCKTCFIHWFEKKVLYTIRKFKMIQKGESLGLKRGLDFRNIVLFEILKNFSIRSGNKIVSPQKKFKMVVANTSDIESREIINEIILGKIDLQKHSPINKKIIKPLCLFTDKEVLLYANLKKLKYQKISLKENEIDGFISEMEKKHPELMHSILNSYLEITKR